MNLLVTNTRNAQAYAIIRALRPHADKIVTTMYGKNRLAARLSHAANSRMVDKRYYVPSPVEDWRAGVIQKANTQREEAYIQTVLKICEQEQIDTIFPSFDPHVYVFSKNKERFERLGIVIPVPDYETVITPLDKYRTILAAREVGFPCPKTYLPESEECLARIAEEIGFPLVIKPRLSAGSRGMEIATGLGELFEKYRLARQNHGLPMIQEFIPGKLNQNIYLTLDQSGELKSVFCPRTHHAFLRLYRNTAAAGESCAPLPVVAEAAKLARKLNWWGGVTIQTKIDQRDGEFKLMEINPRLGTHLWYRTELGINEPWICLNIARGREVDAIKNYPKGTMLLEPVEEAIGVMVGLLDLLIYKFRTRLLGKSPIDPSNTPASLKAVLQSYRECYFNGKKKVFNPYFRYFSQDPLVSILWWLAYLRYVARISRHLGR
jgi:biotin carboxylase